MLHLKRFEPFVPCMGWPMAAFCMGAHYKRAGMKSIAFNIQRECRFNHIALEKCATLASCVLDKMVDSESHYIELNVFNQLIKWDNAPTSDKMNPPDDPSRYFVPLRMFISRVLTRENTIFA